MSPEIFFGFVLAFFILLFVGMPLADDLFDSLAWRGSQRFIVRQIEDGTQRVWTCARYFVSNGKIYFRQEGHRHQTVVSGQWHVEPVDPVRTT